MVLKFNIYINKNKCDMNIDNIRNDLRIFQNSIYVDNDQDIFNKFSDLEKNLIILNYMTDDVKKSTDYMKTQIFNDIIQKTELFNETIILNNYLELISIEYHKKKCKKK